MTISSGRALAVLLLLGCAKPYLGVRADNPPQPPAPAGVTHASETFTGDGGVALFAQSWRPEGPPRGVLIVMHGLRDHGDRYADLAARLVQRGYAVYAFDLPGHGRSAGRRVTVGSFDEYVDDFARYVAAVRAREPGVPLFVFGHSMGGAIVARWAERPGSEAAGAIISSPAIRIDVPPIVAAFTRLSAALTPNFGGLAASNSGFSTDPAVEADMARDPLIYQPGGPVATAAELIGAIERVWAEVDRLRIPLLCLHGRADTLTAPAGSRDLCHRAGSSDRTLHIYDGLAHDLVHEPKKDEVIADIAGWLDGHTGAAAAVPPATLDTGLAGEGRKPSASLAVEGAFRWHDDARWGGAVLRTRWLFGGRLAWPLALDGEVLGGEGLVYRAAAYPLGLAVVSAGGDNLSLAVGAGVADAGAGTRFELPAALDGELQLGPLRALVWARLSWLPADEDAAWHLGVALRLGADHRYWSTANAGLGPYLGVTLDGQGDARVYGVSLGLHLWGGT